MATFISKNVQFKVWGENAEWSAAFAPMGRYATNDEKIIEALRTHPYFNRSFSEIKIPPKGKSNIIQGVRSAGTQPIRDREAKLMRLGELQARLLKNDGSFRKDASDELINELKELKGELGV